MVSVAALPTTIKWVKPSPLWEPQATDMAKPFLAEFDNDRFLPYFLDLMGGKVPDKTPANLSEHQVVLQNGIGKLYQPLHGHYYLVTGSLVCRQLGLPDHTVASKNGEKVSFVLRRLTPKPSGPGFDEFAWVNDGSNKNWQQLNNPMVLLKNEERLPMHPVTVANSTPASPGARSNGSQPTASPRKVYHGYIPVDSREKYLMPATKQSIQNLIDKDPTIDDPRLDELTTRIIEAWRAIYVYFTYTSDKVAETSYSNNPSQRGTTPGSQVAPTQDIEQQISLNVIVDLGDFLQNYLPSVYNAIVNGTSLPSSQTKRQALLTELQNIRLDTNDPANPHMSLANAIKKLSDSANLARAETDPSPLDTYDLLNATANGMLVNMSNASYLTSGGPLYNLFRDALDEGKSDNPNAWLTVPPEIGNMIKDEQNSGDSYCLRLVYEHDPCDPVLSDPSDSFSFAKVFDPDAPARHIRIELPSMKLKDLRKYKRGIGMQMSKELGDVVNRVNPGMLKDSGGLRSGGPALGIAMICSFSIPIITICALIVMFIFLILLNFIFWWLPFIRICFPIPKPK